MFDYSLFLAGPPLLKRALILEAQPLSQDRVSNQGFIAAQVANPVEEIVLRYAPKGMQSTAGCAGTNASSGGFFCNTIGFADGGLDLQALAQTTSSLSDNVIWCGDGDSISLASKEIIERLSFNTANTQWPLMCMPAPKHITRLDFQTAKAFSDAAGLFEHVIADCTATLARTILQKTKPKSLQSFNARTVPLQVTLEIIGALGGRRDHELANLRELRSLFFGSALRRVLHNTLAKVLEVSAPMQQQQNFEKLVRRFQKQLCFTCILQPSIVLSHRPVKIFGLPEGFPLGIFGPDESLAATVAVIEGLVYNGKVTLRRASHGLSNAVAAHEVKVAVLSRRAGRAKGSNRKPQAAEISPFVEIVLGHNEQEWIQT